MDNQSELSFLLDLLLNQRLSNPVKKLVADRLKSIEAQHKPVARPQIVHNAPQGNAGELLPPVPTTQAAAEALAARQAAIAQAMSGKAEPGRTSPRKF